MAHVGFAFGSSFFAFAAFNFLGQFAKAGGWPAMTKIVGQWYPERRYGQVWSIISTSSRVGTIAAGLVLGYLLRIVGWRTVFLVSSLLTGGVVVLLYFFLRETPRQVGLLLTSFVYDRLTKLRLIWTLGGLLILSCLCVLMLWNLDVVPTSIRSPAAIGTIFMLGLSISPAYYVPMSVFAVAFGGKHSGFLVALIDVFGYCGAILFNYYGGSIAEHYGWSVFLSGLLTIAISATFCMVTFLTLDWRSELLTAK